MTESILALNGRTGKLSYVVWGYELESMIKTPIPANPPVSAWLVDEDDTYRFEATENPRSKGPMAAQLRRGHVHLAFHVCDGDKIITGLFFDLEHCDPKSMQTAVRSAQLPLIFAEVNERTKNRIALTLEQAEAILNDMMFYRSLATVDTTVIFERPALQIETSSDSMKSTLEAWKGAGELQKSRLIEVYNDHGNWIVGSVGTDSLAARSLGVGQALQMSHRFALSPFPNQYEIATVEGYKMATDRDEPVLQDVMAVVEIGDIRREEAYRRLILPVGSNQNRRRVMVFSEPIEALEAA